MKLPNQFDVDFIDPLPVWEDAERNYWNKYRPTAVQRAADAWWDAEMDLIEAQQTLREEEYNDGQEPGLFYVLAVTPKE